MNKKEHKGFERAWSLVLVGAMLAFFVGISANAIFVYFESRLGVGWTFVGSTIFAFSFSWYISFFLKNFRELRDKSDFQIFKLWLKEIVSWKHDKQ